MPSVSQSSGLKAMQSVSPLKMQKIDRIAQEKFGIPAVVLMENAGRASFDLARKMLPAKNKRVVCICGKGNNGGDGFVCSRHLLNNKITTVFDILLNSPVFSELV